MTNILYGTLGGGFYSCGKCEHKSDTTELEGKQGVVAFQCTYCGAWNAVKHMIKNINNIPEADGEGFYFVPYEGEYGL